MKNIRQQIKNNYGIVKNSLGIIPALAQGVVAVMAGRIPEKSDKGD